MAKKKKIEKAPREMTRRQISRHKKQQRRQRFIFFGGLAIIIAVVLIIVGGWFIGEYLPLRTTIIEVYDTSFDTAYLIDTLVIYGMQQGGAESLVGKTNDVINTIMSNELLKLEAAKLGITVSDEEAARLWEGTGININDAALNIARAGILLGKLRSGHFDGFAFYFLSFVDVRCPGSLPEREEIRDPLCDLFHHPFCGGIPLRLLCCFPFWLQVFFGICQRVYPGPSLC